MWLGGTTGTWFHLVGEIYTLVTGGAWSAVGPFVSRGARHPTPLGVQLETNVKLGTCATCNCVGRLQGAPATP